MAKKKLTKGRIARMEEKARKEKQRKRNIILITVGAILLLAAIITGIVLAVNYEAPEPLYYAEISIKDAGVVKVELNSGAAPKTVEKFIDLANKGVYNGTSFYELTGGKLYGGDRNIDVAHIYGEFNNGLTNEKGVVSMSRSGLNSVNPAIFFINMKDNQQHDNETVEFGKVTSGLELLENFDISEGNIPVIEKIIIISE
ncbi:MAG: peptidylprolyl isomerase [Clostridia bacterium]|nr:peptidylprolyl isomerase [Clostridia bacterium]